MRFNRTILSVLAMASGMLVAVQVTSAEEVLFGLGAGAGSQRYLYTVDPMTAEATPVGSGTGYMGESLAFDPSSGQLFSVDNIADVLITIDMTTGVGSYVASLSLASNISDLTFGPDGTLFASNLVTPRELVTIDTSTGEVTVIGPFGPDVPMEGLAYDAGEGFLWATHSGGTHLFSVDPATGVATFVRNLPTWSLALSMDASGTLYGTSVNELWNFSTDTLVGHPGVNFPGLEFVPEPACLSMVALGVVIIMRRRQLA